ncbi:MAG: hypothetical protein ABJO01_08575 [Parasphingorhabdus sp.]|uniref:hypothetical protein n=1 Tax=Parasphingorhabdus sp. TaxID=2709688 RepID=UPI00329955A4
MEWLDVKIWLESETGLDRDALHIYGALFIQFLLAAFFRRSIGSIWPWFAVLLAAIANEYLDYQRVGETEASIALFQAEGLRDMWNTMVIPTALMIIARYWPNWMVGKAKKSDETQNNAQSENQLA